MITKICPKHKCIVSSGKCTEYDIDKKTGARIQCNEKLEDASALFWCDVCRVPSYYSVCSKCHKSLEYLCTDIRPVFPEEKLLYAIMKKKDPSFYQKTSMWCTANTYIIDGKKEKIPVTEFNRLFPDTVYRIGGRTHLPESGRTCKGIPLLPRGRLSYTKCFRGNHSNAGKL